MALLIASCCLAPLTGEGADAPDEDDPPVDINVIRMKAEAGSVHSQTMLADWYASSSDFTNAVFWYRKAAEQGSVSAQLSLASLLITGRGTAKNPQEAAKWLRQAANGIEAPKPPLPVAAAASATATNRPPVTNAPVVRVVAAAPTNSSSAATQVVSRPPRIERVSVLQVPEPALPDAPPAVRPPPEPR